ncbi:MAG: hypothetical protein BWY70_01720 [Bacteroidetes bacterium ADurb.Bin408]|nr:MAG: hypothetical protein BWY70_01720 [Bacteroidetes bacterium ADurb.Bin408]
MLYSVKAYFQSFKASACSFKNLIPNQTVVRVAPATTVFAVIMVILPAGIPKLISREFPDKQASASTMPALMGNI